MQVVTYTELHKIISESISSVLAGMLITESQESKSISEAIKLYMEHTGDGFNEANNYVRFEFRAKFPILRTKNGGKFILGVMRMYLDGELNDGETQARLNTVLKYVSDPTHVNQYDRNLNNLSTEELIRRFASVQVQDMEKDRNEVGSIQREVNSDYTVVPINSFEEAKKYGSYNDWCLAQENGEGMYDEYTKKGINQLYFILRKGFENEPRKAGPNTPFDSYGLSMMTVIVDPDGQMAQSTTRWNHDNGSSDSVLTTKQISDIIGRNFYDVFKPNNRFKDAVSMAMNKFSNGTPADDAFDEYVPCKDGPHLIRVMGRWNAIKPSEDKKAGPVLVSKIWYDDMFPFFEGYAKVSDDNKGSNFINEQGQLLLKRWYFDVGYFKGGVAPVFDIKRGWTAVNRNGELITDMFFTGMDFAGSGMLKVRSRLGQNFLTAEGKLLSDEWFDDVAVFRDGIAKVARSSKYNFINMQGRLLSELWFDRVGKMSPDGAVVMVAGRGYNYLKPNGRLLLKQWMDYVNMFIDGYGVVEKDNRKNIVDVGGKYISNTWYENVFQPQNGAAKVSENGKYNFMNMNGELISDTWFDGASDFGDDGTATVFFSGDKEGFEINLQGKVVGTAKNASFWSLE